MCIVFAFYKLILENWGHFQAKFHLQYKIYSTVHNAASSQISYVSYYTMLNNDSRSKTQVSLPPPTRFNVSSNIGTDRALFLWWRCGGVWWWCVVVVWWWWCGGGGVWWWCVVVMCGGGVWWWCVVVVCGSGGGVWWWCVVVD